MMKQKINFIGYFILLLLAIIIPLFFGSYRHHMMVMILIYSQLALSLDIIMGDMAQFSFGHQAFFGVAAFTTAILSVKLNLPVWLGMITGITFSLILGFLVGNICLKKSRGFYLGIVTLGFGQILYLFAMRLRTLTGGLTGIPNIPPINLGNIQLNTPFKFYYFQLFSLIVTIYLINIWRSSRIGKAVKAIGQNETLSNSIGIDTYKVYNLAFTFACALAGVAGVSYSHYMLHISPISMGMPYMFGMLVMVIIGGKGTIGGPILGAIIYVLLPELFAKTMEYRLLIFGILVLFSIIFLKQGFYPFLKSMCEKIYKYLEKRIF